MKHYTDQFEIPFEKYVLDNGLEVVLHQDHTDPVIAVAILFNVGSAREESGKTGFAHFFEHMLFQNSENVGKGNFFRLIEEMGGTLNGGTWRDGTVYYEVVPKDGLERVLWMESDRMGYMINTVSNSVFENEKEVVKNEKRQRIDNQPYGYTQTIIDEALYPGHPYGWQVIGSMKDLQKATLDDVRNFYHKWYGPNNATLVIAGDFELPTAKKFVDQYFGEIPAKKPVEKLRPLASPLSSVRKIYYEDPFAKLPELNMVWPAVEERHEDNYPLSYLTILLANGKRAPLFKLIVEERKLAPSVSFYQKTGEVAGSLNLQIRTNEDINLADVEKAVFDSLTLFEKNGIDDRDMMRIQNSLETNFYEGLSNVLMKSFQLAHFNEFEGDPGFLKVEIQKILAVTKTQILDVYERYMKNKPYVATSFVPKGAVSLVLKGSESGNTISESSETSQRGKDSLHEDNIEFERTPTLSDRSVPPPLGDPPLVKTPDIYSCSDSGTMRVWGIQDRELPIVHFSLRILGGLHGELPEPPGSLHLLSGLMMEGTRGKTPEQLEDAIGQLGASIYVGASDEFMHIEGSCLSKNFDDVVNLFEEILLEPRWDEKEFIRLKDSLLTQIVQRTSRQELVAISIMNKLLYGSDHPLSRDIVGMTESVRQISIEDLRSLYERSVVTSRSSFHFCGNLDHKIACRRMEKLTDSWGRKGSPVAIGHPAVKDPGTRIYFIDFPDSHQSVITFGQLIPEGNHPDFNKIRVANHRLGGSYTGLLNAALREEKGFTYGATTSIVRRLAMGSLVGVTSVFSNVTREAVGICWDILKNYPYHYSREDLNKTKNFMVRKYARDFETLGQKKGMLENISTYGFPENYVHLQQKEVLNLNLNDVQEVLDQYFLPESFVFVIAGDASAHLEGLNDLGLGDPVLLDRYGDPIK